MAIPGGLGAVARSHRARTAQQADAYEALNDGGYDDSLSDEESDETATGAPCRAGAASPWTPSAWHVVFNVD